MKTWHDYYYSQLDIRDFLYRIPTELSPKIKQYAEPGSSILETGIGTAVESIYLSHLGYQVYGIDNDAIIIKRAIKLNKKLEAKASFIQMDIFHIGFKDKSFDVVFHQGLAEHYSEKEIVAILREQLRVGKIIIFSIPSDKFSLRSPGVSPEGIFGNENFWSLKRWQRILRDFKILEIFGGGVVQPKWRRFLINLVYLPFWILNEKIWQRRYLAYYAMLGFVLKEK